MRDIDNRNLAAALCACMCLTAGVAKADDVASTSENTAALAQDIDGLYKSGKYEDALEKLDTLAATFGEHVPAEIAYNRARTLAALNRTDDARNLFRVVLTRAADPKVRAAAAFNLGMIEADRVKPDATESIEQTLDALRRAERLFRIAHQTDAGDGSAAANIDLIQRRIAAIKEKQNQEQQQEQKEQKGEQPNDKQSSGDEQQSNEQGGQSSKEQKSLADQLKDLADKQQNQADQTKELDQKPENGDESKASKQQELNDAAKKQNELRDQTRDAAQQADSKSEGQGEKQPLEDAKKKLEEAQRAQQEAEQQLKDGKTDEASKSQQRAADALREAAKQAQGSEERSGQEQLQEQQAAAQPYDATAAKILDRERKWRDQMRQLQMQRSRLVPVEKDW